MPIRIHPYNIASFGVAQYLKQRCTSVWQPLVIALRMNPNRHKNIAVLVITILLFACESA